VTQDNPYEKDAATSKIKAEQSSLAVEEYCVKIKSFDISRARFSKVKIPLEEVVKRP
jgi:hypothetical protein